METIRAIWNRCWRFFWIFDPFDYEHRFTENEHRFIEHEHRFIEHEQEGRCITS